MKKVLLHSCCAPCGGHVIERLKQEGNYVAVLFFNPNVHPKQEHDKREEEIRTFCANKNIDFFSEKYEPKDWFNLCEPLKEEPEGGKRCFLCYRLRLARTARFAKEKGFDEFASTLSISPHKKADIINEIGTQIATALGIKFLVADWKKQDGFKKSCQLARDHGFYRQDYCGCAYSKR